MSIKRTITVGPYKEYYGHAEYDVASGSYHGDVEDIRDVVTFVGDDFAGVLTAFRDSIDEYLAMPIGK